MANDKKQKVTYSKSEQIILDSIAAQSKEALLKDPNKINYTDQQWFEFYGLEPDEYSILIKKIQIDNDGEGSISKQASNISGADYRNLARQQLESEGFYEQNTQDFNNGNVVYGNTGTNKPNAVYGQVGYNQQAVSNNVSINNRERELADQYRQQFELALSDNAARQALQPTNQAYTPEQIKELAQQSLTQRDNEQAVIREAASIRNAQASSNISELQKLFDEYNSKGATEITPFFEDKSYQQAEFYINATPQQQHSVDSYMDYLKATAVKEIQNQNNGKLPTLNDFQKLNQGGN